MKKIAVLFLSLLLCVPSVIGLADEVAAYNTDICAYINNYAIPSFAYNGKTVIVVDDLKNFGFTTNFDASGRTLDISRDPAISKVYEMKVSKMGRTGTKLADVYPAKIVVRAKGRNINAYNVNGYLMVPIDELDVFGEVLWNGETRTVNMRVEGLEFRPVLQEVQPYSEPKTAVYAIDGRTLYVPISEVSAYLKVGWYSTKAEATYFREKAAAEGAASKGDYATAMNTLEAAADTNELRNTIYADDFGAMNRVYADNWRNAIKDCMPAVTYKIGNNYGVPVASILFRNLSYKTIKAFKAVFTCYDVFGNVVESYYSSYMVDNANIGPTGAGYASWNLYGISSVDTIRNIKVIEIVFTDGTKLKQ